MSVRATLSVFVLVSFTGKSVFLPWEQQNRLHQDGGGGKEGNRRTTGTGEGERDGSVPAVFVQVVVVGLVLTLTPVPFTLECTELLVVAESGSMAAPAEWPPLL